MIHLPSPQVASSLYANRTTVIADASGFHLCGSGSANNQDATEPGHTEFEDSDDEDEDFEDFESDILGLDSSNESDGDLDGGDIDNVDLEELAQLRRCTITDMKSHTISQLIAFLCHFA